MTMRILKQLVFLTLVLFLAGQTGYATTLVVQKEISVSRALAGQVLVKGTDEPADGVTVELRSSDWKTVLASTKTDAKGTFPLNLRRAESSSTSECRHRVWIFTSFEYASRNR